jgi:uncharacterized protein
MIREMPRTVCWSAIWNPKFKGLGLENAALTESGADSVLLAFSDDGTPLRLIYRLTWDDQVRIREADLEVQVGQEKRSLLLRSDGEGHWRHAHGDALPELDGCIDIDIWPTPLTNSLPLWRSSLGMNQRQEYRMAWVSAPELTVEAKPQEYTRLKDGLYLFESLDGSGFRAELAVDDQLIVVDYPGLFLRVGPAS